MALTKVTYSMIDGATVNVLDYGADPTGVSDSTAAIDAAIATYKSVWFPNGTYLTTGNHELLFRHPTTNEILHQSLIGEGNAVIKKMSGTNILLQCEQQTNATISNLTFDGNDLGGSLILWRGHYSLLNKIKFQNQGGTSYALWISGCNVSTFNSLEFGDTCYGGLLFDHNNDPSATPAYSCLYSSFNQIVVGTTHGGSCIEFAPASLEINLTFNECTMEGNAGGSVSPIDINGQGVRNITFNSLNGEYMNLGTTPYINIRGQECIDIAFVNGYWASNYNNTAPVINTQTYVRGLTIDGVFFTENGATPSTAGRYLIQLASSRDVVIRNCTTRFINNHYFVKSELADANSYINVENNYNNQINLGADGNFAGVMTLILQGDFISAKNSNMLHNIAFTTNYSVDNVAEIRSAQNCGKITVADDSYYEIHGFGGSSAAPDFKGVITIAQGGATAAGSQVNNFATFYAQVGSAIGVTQKADIVIGSNVEIDIIENDVAALANTTDGKLGIQMGYAASGPNRYVRVYNRTGAEIQLAVNVLFIY